MLAATQATLHPIDWLAIALYAVTLIVVGVLYSRKVKNSEDYLLGGRRMKSFAVGVSLFASLISTISYLATPGEMIKHGPGYLSYMFAIPVVFLVVGYVLIPYLMRLPVTSAYEILEGRLGPNIRLLGTTIFLFTRLAWMGLIIYVVSEKVIVVIMGWSPDVAPYVCAAIGGLTLVYTTMGGLRAVVAADVIQSFILAGGAVIALLVITVKLGGVGAWWPSSWAPAWDAQPFFSLDPHVRLTVFGSMLAYVLWWIFTAGSDQMAIQRYLATRDARAARRAFLINSLAETLVTLVLALLGFALLAFYRQAGASEAPPDADQYFSRFIIAWLPAGLSGLVISGLLASAMGSLSSGINSSATVVVVDFLRRWRPRPTGDEEMRLSRRVTLLVGCAAVGLSLIIGRVPGNLIEVTSKTNGLFLPALFGLFFMALFVPFATPSGAAAGALTGLAAAFAVAYWDVITGGRPISFQWILPVSIVVNIMVGCLVSLVTSRHVAAGAATAIHQPNAEPVAASSS